MAGEKSSPIWHGRFSKAPAKGTQDFVESLSFDYRLYKHDIAGSIAHAKMLQSVGLIKKKDLLAITKGLKQIAEDIDAGRFTFDPADEDIHMAIETALIRNVGEPGKKLHTARSRNDQVALDIRLYLRDFIDLKLLPAVSRFQKECVELAGREGMAVMPGYTHMQHAQPVLGATVLLNYVEQLERDRERLIDCRQRLDVMPLGSCALAGTTLPIDRKQTAKELGFSQISRNSIDAISDRDFAIELLFDLSMAAMHLSRWSEDWILFSSSEFDFIELDERYCTGSSIMPQKRNPDILELIRGKTGRVYGCLISMLTMLKGLPTGYNRDLQEDKIAIFDSCDTVLASLNIAAELVKTTHLKSDKMKFQTEKGFIEATGIAEYLVAKNVPFRDAHKIVGNLVAYCEKNNKNLSDLSLDELKSFEQHIESDIKDVISAENLTRAYKSYGSAGVASIREQLKYWDNTLSERK